MTGGNNKGTEDTEMTDSEMWKGYHQMHKDRKASNYQKALDRFDELPKGTKKFTDHHWGIPTPYGMHINYWPSTGLWDDPRPRQKSKRQVRGDFDSFMGWLRKFLIQAEKEQAGD